MADRWFTYEEAGALFGLSAEAMRKRSRRLRWQVQPPNDSQGKARILIPEGTELRPAGPPAGIPSGDRPDGRSDDLLVELRRRAEAAEADRDRERAERERVEGERENLATGLIIEREGRARAEGEAAALREVVVRQDQRIEQETGRADRERAAREAAELGRDAARAAAEGAHTARQAAERERDAARSEVAELTAGGPLVRAWRGFWRR